jgi:hypothetical protein
MYTMHGTYTYIRLIVLKSRGSVDIAIEIKAEFLYRSSQDLTWNWNWGVFHNIYVPLQALIVSVARVMEL